MVAITLTYNDRDLIGKYGKDSGDVLVLLDSTIGAFSVTLPDLLSCGNRVFMFKNYGANAVTLNTIHGQPIDFAGVLSASIAYKQFYSISSNGIDKWISLETSP